MKRPRIGIVRYSSVARAIAEALRVNPPPDFRVGRGRVTLKFRQTGASLWPEEQRIEYALHVANVVRSILSADPRRLVRRQANRAVGVLFIDAALDRGCDVSSRWECVVPMAALHDADVI
ncbi:MAG TPA: hypothetical protein VM939_07775 [Gemmatimonadaceae bacterium]|nr:hypothetical protein [Gemmatimonadaceae bacterium]